jgi:hypothetical protein
MEQPPEFNLGWQLFKRERSPFTDAGRLIFPLAYFEIIRPTLAAAAEVYQANG